MSAVSGTLGFRNPQRSNEARALAEGTPPKIESGTTSSLTKSAGFRTSLAANSASNRATITATPNKTRFINISFSFMMGFFGPGPRLVELEFLLPIAGFGQGGLVFLVEDIVAEHQVIHFSAHKAAVGIFGRANDGLTAHVEAGVDDHAVARLLLELVDQFPVAWIG